MDEKNVASQVNSEHFKNDILKHKKMAELQYVTALYSNRDFYDEYKIDPKLITNPHWRMYYLILEQIITKKKVQTIDEINMDMFVSEQKEALKKVYDGAGGFATIKEAMSIIETDNIESYYMEVLRYSAITKLIGVGFNVEKNWDKIRQLSYQELNDYITGTVDTIFSSIDMGEDKEQEILSGIKGMIQRAHEGVRRGLPLASKILNSVVNGQVLGNITMVGGASGVGKAQPTNTIIPTPNGDKKLGELSIGDYVFDRLGKPTKVTGIFPQGKIDAYEVTLSDGRRTICNDQHLWSYYTSKGNLQTKTLRDMLEIGIDRNGKRWNIPTNGAVVYSEKELPIDPYALGALIGDGSLTSDVLTISSVDEFVVEKVSKRIGAIDYKKVSSDNHSWVFHSNPVTYSYTGHYGQTINKKKFQIRTSDIFNNLPELMTTSHHKHIPSNYMYGSIQQRQDLLNGLMDTDGHIYNKDRFSVNYSTSSKHLAEDVRVLCLSLGYLATVSDYYRDEKGMEYRVNINIPNERKQELFTLPRRLEVANEAARFKKKRNYGRISIADVSKLEEEQEMLCIMVDNDEHLYLTNDFIVTHNTFLTLNQILPSVIQEKEPILIMCNEEEVDKWQGEMLTWVINNHLKNGDFVKSRFYQGDFSEEEMNHLTLAEEWLSSRIEDGLIRFVNFNMYSMDKAIRLIRKYAKQRDTKYFIVDTLKLDNDIGSSVGDNSWLQLQQNMVKLYNVIKPSALNVHVWVTYQLSKTNKTRYLDQSSLGISKNVADVVSTLILVRNVLESEKGSNGLVIKNGGQTVNLDEGREYMVAFLDKNRQGSTHNQIVWDVDKGRNIIKDEGFTKISQDF